MSQMPVIPEQAVPHVLAERLDHLTRDFEQFREEVRENEAARKKQLNDMASVLNTLTAQLARYEGKLGGLILAATLIFSALFALKEEIVRFFSR